MCQRQMGLCVVYLASKNLVQFPFLAKAELLTWSLGFGESFVDVLFAACECFVCSSHAQWCLVFLWCCDTVADRMDLGRAGKVWYSGGAEPARISFLFGS